MNRKSEGGKMEPGIVLIAESKTTVEQFMALLLKYPNIQCLTTAEDRTVMYSLWTITH